MRVEPPLWHREHLGQTFGHHASYSGLRENVRGASRVGGEASPLHSEHSPSTTHCRLHLSLSIVDGLFFAREMAHDITSIVKNYFTDCTKTLLDRLYYVSIRPLEYRHGGRPWHRRVRFQGDHVTHRPHETRRIPSPSPTRCVDRDARSHHCLSGSGAADLTANLPRFVSVHRNISDR